MNIIPTILSGGSGTRLWPLSRASKPKQFLTFITKHSLFQETVLRCNAAIFDGRPIVVGSDAHRFLLAEDLQEIGVQGDILLEPVARNSCAAIAVGAMQAMKRNRDAMILVLAADHYIPDAGSFAEAVARAAEDAADGYLVTFGVKPNRPVTGYGYIAPGTALKNAKKVDTFVEKPDAETSASYVANGYLWNSGNFLFRSDAFLQALADLRPDILDCTRRAFDNAMTDLDFIRLDEEAFGETPAISVDYAIMEETDRAAVLPVDYRWSDIGNWASVADVLAKDEHGNAVVGEGRILNGHGNLVHSSGKLTTLVGVDGLAVVVTRDSVLVADMARAEDVKALVQMLQDEGDEQANVDLQIFRPWGNYEQLDIGEGYQVKRIIVKPGGELSLQKHECRAENWVVVSGEVEVTIGAAVSTLQANQAAYVEKGQVHRLVNRGDVPAVLIEVQTGDYLGEDDIIRLEDSYNRKQQPQGIMD